jgi:hypothetical protein
MFGTARVTIIDKNTGKVLYDKEVHNVILENGVRNALHIDAGKSYNPITRVILYNSSKEYVTSISGSWGTPYTDNNSIACNFTATDNSTNAYTFRYMELDKSYEQQPVYGSGYFNNDRGSNVSKSASQTLTITWKIANVFLYPTE